MAYEANQPLSLDASADLSASQYCGVNVDANGQLALPAAGGRIIGVLQTKPSAAGRAGTVYGVGMVSKVKAGAGGITAGDDLKVEADGEFVTGAATNVCVAVCLEGAAAGELGTALIVGQYVKP